MKSIVFAVLFGILSLGFIGFSDVYASNDNLFVSAENSQFDNYMSGPQVIEVIVIDSDLNDLDVLEEIPDVTVNGKEMIMTQGVDGNWYGYFASYDMALIADSTVTNAGEGLDFGAICDYNFTYQTSNDPDSTIVRFSDTRAVAFPDSSVLINSVNGQFPPQQIPFGQCDNLVGSLVDGPNEMNVVREAIAINENPNVPPGQNGISPALWPFVNLYSLAETGNVVIQYNKGGGAQSTTLTFDTVDNFAAANADRTIYPRNAQVHITLTDLWLNIDPTDEDSWTFGTNGITSTNYQVFDENGLAVGDTPGNTDDNLLTDLLSQLMCEDNCILLINPNTQSASNSVLTLQDNDDTEIIGTNTDDALSFRTIGGNLDGTIPVTITETSSKSNMFSTFDESDVSILKTTSDALRGTSATIDYNETPFTVLIGFDFGTINMDQNAIGAEWTSGEEIPLILIDSDLNKNSRQDEDLDFYNPKVELIPVLVIGTPFTLETLSDVQLSNTMLTIQDVQAFSQRALLDTSFNSIPIQDGDSLVLTTGNTFADLYESINDSSNDFQGFNFFNYDIRSLQKSATVGSIISFDIDITDGTSISRLASDVTAFNDNLIDLSFATGNDIFSMDVLSPVQIIFTFDVVTGNPVTGGIVLPTEVPPTILPNTVLPIASDFFSFGIINDGALPSERISNMIIRAELEETGDNTGIFVGSLQYTMLNQLNVKNPQTYDELSTISDELFFIIPLGLTDEDAPRINYLDLGQDGVSTQIADQQEAPSHSGVVSFDSDTYNIGNRVDITLNDFDLSTSVNLVDIYTSVSPSSFPTDPARDTIGENGLGLYSTNNLGAFGTLLDVTFNGEKWSSGETLNGGVCGTSGTPDDGLSATGLILVETGSDSGIFNGNFMIPSTYCNPATGLIETTPGKDMAVNYVDYADAGNSIIKVGYTAGIRANTGSVTLDRVVYPVPFGSVSDFFPGLSESDSVTPDGDSIFPVHQTGVTADGDQNIDAITEEITSGDLLIHIRINDSDFDILSNGLDTISFGENGPVKIMLTRGSDTLLLATAGGSAVNNGVITHGTNVVSGITRDVGPINEIAPNAGIFEFTLPIRYTDGPDNLECPETPDNGYISLNGDTGSLGRFDELPQNGSYCILSGDVISVQYNDPSDASGSPNVVTTDATVALRDGVLQTDKVEYVIRSDMIFTLIDPDFNLDSDTAETYDLDLIEWDSESVTLTVGDLGGDIDAFYPEPLYLRETGDNTGIFQVVLEIPQTLLGETIEEGEEIKLEYVDWGPANALHVGEESLDVSTEIITVDFTAEINTDSTSYNLDDTITVTGSVSPIILSQPIILQIINPDGDTVIASQTNSLPDGTFSQQFVVTSPLWDVFGTYEIKVHYFTATASTLFTVGDVAVEKFVEPQLRENLTDKMIQNFEKKVDVWEKRVDRLENRIDKLEDRAQKAEDKGKLDKAQRLRVNAADAQDRIEIFQDFIQITNISIGVADVVSVPVEFQDNLLPKSIEQIEKNISKWDDKIDRLNEKADKLDEKASTLDAKAVEKREQGKDKKADNLEAKADRLEARADALRDQAKVFEDLNDVLKYAINDEYDGGTGLSSNPAPGI